MGLLDLSSVPLPRPVGLPVPFAELILLESPSEPVVLECFTVLAESLVPPAARSSDVLVVAPDGERWKVSDLEPFLRKVSVSPLHRHVICLLSVHLMEPAVLDSLLKVLEEPSAPSTIVVSAPSASDVPLTLRSRVLESFAPRPVRRPDLAQILTNLSFPPTLVDVPAVEDLLELVSTSPVAPTLAGCFAAHVSPVCSVQEWIRAVDDLVRDLDLPSSTVKRLKVRLVEMYAIVAEQLVMVGLSNGHGVIDACSVDAVAAARRTLRDALRKGCVPAPQLTVFAGVVFTCLAAPTSVASATSTSAR